MYFCGIVHGPPKYASNFESSLDAELRDVVSMVPTEAAIVVAIAIVLWCDVTIS